MERRTEGRSKDRRGRWSLLSLAPFLMGAALGPIPLRASAQTLGQGPFHRLVIRGVRVIDGTGGPPFGPADVVVEGDRITDIRIVGHPLGKIDEEHRPARGDHEIDGTGMYLLPGFIDSHVHIPGPSSTKTGLDTRYYFYLNLVHGITSVVDVVSSEPLAWTVDVNKKATANQMDAPRVFAFARLSVDEHSVNYKWDGVINTPALGRQWVDAVARGGAVGIKLRGSDPKVTAAVIDEAHKLGLVTTMHLEQRGAGRLNIIKAARLGLDRMDHWYGLASSMLALQSTPSWRPAYLYNNEQDRWRDAGLTWAQAVEADTPQWTAVMDELLERGFTICPTEQFYDYLRDPMARRQLEWHDAYTSPALLDGWSLKIGNHPGILDWTTRDEANWYHFFVKWQRFLREYNRRGGRIVAGSDAGSGYGLYGFAFIRELELLQQTGLLPTEVIRSATLYGAQYLGVDDDLGSIEVGKIADLSLVDANPLENLKVLYAIGHLRYNPELGHTERVGGVKYTIRGGVVYDDTQLQDSIKAMVRTAKQGHASG